MAQTQTNSNQKKMEYKKVSFDVNEIAPDAPAGEWRVSIPRGKCKVQPTKEDHYPMLIVPIRLDSTDEDEEVYTKALATELSVMIVFFGDEKARAAKMSKLRLRQLCEATDVDLDLVPKVIEDPEVDLEPLIRALEGSKFTAWTVLSTRKDTGEVTTEVRFQDPKGSLKAASDDDDDEDEDEPKSERQPRGKAKPSSKNGKSRR